MGTLVLGAKSRKAKNRIRQWGIKWEILRESNDSWLVVAFQDSTDTNESVRWINKYCDPDFNVLEYAKEE
jgi:hypothetical protein